jgi:gamma-glutamylcyclotransferase (GGCT)/AIG2-like uncharacterized protein YtfP
VGEYLFVYGTLRSGYRNAYALKLRAEADFVGPAVVKGSIFRIARYPGYREEPDGDVHGELYRLSEPEKTLAALDDHEGSEYQRVRVETSGGHAWIYRYYVQPPESARIASGDFSRP